MKINKKGFTLIELLIVIAIIAILAAIIIANTTGAQSQARDSRRIQDLDQIALALVMYYSEENSYPNETTVEASFNKLVEKGYLSAVPKDPQTDGYYGYKTGTKSGSTTPKILLMATLENDNKALDSDVDVATNCIDTPATPAIECGDASAPYHYCVCR